MADQRFAPSKSASLRTEQVGHWAGDDPFPGAPVLVLPRTKILRIVAGVPLGAVAVLCGWGAVASFLEKPPESVAGIILGAVAAAAGWTLGWLLRRGAGREVRLYAEGIEEVLPGRTTRLRFGSVTEVWIRAVGIQAGGLLGAGIAIAVEAASKKKGGRLSETSTNITVRIVAPTGKVVLTSNYKGIVAALEEVMRRVNPRLVEEKLAEIQEAKAVSFGKFTASNAGIAFGRKEPIPFSEVEGLTLSRGRLTLKRRGKWLATASVAADKVPNLYVLTELLAKLAGGDAKTETGPGKNLASKAWV